MKEYMLMMCYTNYIMKKYVVFDFDGTLVNTNDVIIASWQATFEHFLGHRESEEKIKDTFGETLVYTVGVNFPGLPTEDVICYYRDYQMAHCDEMVCVFDGIVDMLKELKDRGYKLAIATSRTHKGTLDYLNQFGMREYFDAVVSMEDVDRHKPDPDTCLVALSKLGATPEESVMLGDTRFDVGCANNAGVDSILVGWSGVTTEEKLKSIGYEPTYCIDAPMDLIELLEKI